VCGRFMSPAWETQSMQEIRLLRGRLPCKGEGLTGMFIQYVLPSMLLQKIVFNSSIFNMLHCNKLI